MGFFKDFNEGYDAVGKIGEGLAMKEVNDWEVEKIVDPKTGKPTWNFGGKSYDTELTDDQISSARNEGLAAAKRRWGSEEDAMAFEQAQREAKRDRLSTLKAEDEYNLHKSFNSGVMDITNKANLGYGVDGGFKDKQEHMGALGDHYRRHLGAGGMEELKKLGDHEMWELDHRAKKRSARLNRLLDDPTSTWVDMEKILDPTKGDAYGIKIVQSDDGFALFKTDESTGETIGPPHITAKDELGFRKQLRMFGTPSGAALLEADSTSKQKADAAYNKLIADTKHVMANTDKAIKSLAKTDADIGLIAAQTAKTWADASAAGNKDYSETLFKTLGADKNYQDALRTYVDSIGTKNEDAARKKVQHYLATFDRTYRDAKNAGGLSKGGSTEFKVHGKID